MKILPTYAPRVSRDTADLRPVDKVMNEPERIDRWQDEYERHHEAQQVFARPRHTGQH